MTRFLTRLGKVGDGNRVVVRLSPRLHGSYGGTVRREGFAVGIYGEDLKEALKNSLCYVNLENLEIQN